jgi:hypothetical protein
MIVFLGFGYNDNDKWVVDLVIPFLQTLGCEVLTGEEMQGENLAQGVLDRIKEADVCVGLLTKRDDPDGDGIFNTHKWVIQELAAAAAANPKKPTFEIIEKGVDPQKGMLGGNQHLVFEDKAILLLHLAKFIMKEKGKLAFKTFMLLPEALSESIRLNLKFTTCKYRFWHKGKDFEPQKADLLKMPAGYSVIIRNIPSDDALVELLVENPAGTWSSPFVPVSSINVELSKSD